MMLTKEKKYKLLGIGYFPDKKTKINGQSIRSEAVFEAISEKFKYKTIKLKYNYWKKKPISTLFKYIVFCARTEMIILFPDANAIKLLIPLTNIMKKIFRFKLHYVVIGGWITNFLQEKPKFIVLLNKLDGIFVQTNYLKTELNAIGIEKIEILPNFRNYKSINVPYKVTDKLKFIYFSRITDLKGVDDMVEAFDYFFIQGYKFHIDIYGPIDKNFSSIFYELINEKKYISYCGEYEALKAPELLSKYFMQVFPTKFRTEGFPGSILDSLFAGLPIIASNWNSSQEVIENFSTGLIYNFNDLYDFKEKIKFIFENPEKILEMREKCIIESRKFEYEVVVNKFFNILISR